MVQGCQRGRGAPCKTPRPWRVISSGRGKRMQGAPAAAPDPDVQAVGRCRAGEADAFAEIVERHQAAVYGTALRLIGDRDAALEVASTAFYKAYRALASLDLTRPLRPWLVKIASNEALNYLRDQGRTARQTLAGEAGQAALESLPSAQADPEAGPPGR